MKTRTVQIAEKNKEGELGSGLVDGYHWEIFRYVKTRTYSPNCREESKK